MSEASVGPPQPARPWRWPVTFLVAGVLATVLYRALPDGLGQDAVYVAIGFAGVAAIFLGVRWYQPVRRVPWYLMAIGQGIWVFGDAVGAWLGDVEGIETFPTAADVFYVAAYPVIAAGLWLLIRGRRPRRDLAGLLDSATVTVALGLLSWVLLARPTIGLYNESFLTAAVSVSYPVFDILLAGLLIRLLTTPGARTPALVMLMLAVVLLITGDTGSAALNLVAYNSTGIYDVSWLGSYLLWGAAALHPSMYSLSAPTAGQEVTFSRGRLVALTTATLVAPGTLVVQYLIGATLDVWAVVISSVAMFLLVVARMAVAIDQIATVSRQRQRLQEDLAYQAAHDGLTGLPNRAETVRQVRAAMSRAQRTGALIGVLFADLDGFKEVNDSHGHGAGDQVLREAATRMRDAVRVGDMVGRLGGDEFVVLLEPVDEVAAAVAVAERVIAAVSKPIRLPGRGSVRVGASVGVALGQDARTDPEALLQEADVAVYRAKAAGRGRVEVYDPALRDELHNRTRIEARLAEAIATDTELVLHYQPIVGVATGRVEGFEALVRWQTEDGLLPPAAFLPIAEQSDLICDLDAWVLRRATAQLAEWHRAGDPGTTMSVNLSGRHVVRSRIVADVTDALAFAELDPSRLVLEVTETALMDERAALFNLEALRGLGVRVSIDDFGTGHSSMARLESLPVDIVKIDRRFLGGGSSETTLLRLMVQAAHAFGLTVVAEGVEESAQVDLLRALDCESAQGFYFGRPAADITGLEVDRIR